MSTVSFRQRNLTFLQPYNLTEGYKITVLRGGSEYGVVILIVAVGTDSVIGAVIPKYLSQRLLGNQ